jgi:hypothetical protein
LNKFKSKKLPKVEPSDFITFQSSQKVSQLKSIKESKVDNFISSEIIEDDLKTKFLLEESRNDNTKERANSSVLNYGEKSFGPNQLHKIYPQNSSQDTSSYIKQEMYPIISRRNSSLNLNLNKKIDIENESLYEYSVV